MSVFPKRPGAGVNTSIASGTTNPYLLPDGIMTVVAKSPISGPGAICTLTSGGVNELPFTASLLTPVTGSQGTCYTYTSSPIVSESIASTYCTCAALTNGTFVIAYRDSSNYPNYPKFGIYDSTGLQLGTLKIVESNTSSFNTVTALPNGQFIYAYVDSFGYPKFGRYDSSGTLLGSLTIVESVATVGTRYRIYVGALAAGGFVVAYTGASGYPRFARYDSSGVLQGSITIVESVASSYGVGCAGLAGGGFVVTYADASNYTKFGRYNDLGEPRGSLTQVNAVANTVGQAVCGLTNGQFVIAYNSSNAYPYFARYDASGVMQSTQTAVGNFSNSYSINISAMPNGGFVVCYREDNNYPKFSIFNSVGGNLGNINFENVAYTQQVSCSVLPNNQIVGAWLNSSNYPKYSVVNGPAQYIIGIATTSANVGDTFNVIYAGMYNRPGSVLLASDWGGAYTTFDHTANGGCKGTILNKTAYLRGLA